MSKTKAEKQITGKKVRPMMDQESQENYCISLATDLVIERLRNGTASAQEVTHFLKLGSTRAQLEKEKLKNENQLLSAKTELAKSAKVSEELYSKALSAMRHYSGDDV